MIINVHPSETPIFQKKLKLLSSNFGTNILAVRLLARGKSYCKERARLWWNLPKAYGTT